MSRCGRATQLLADWKEHPKGCKSEHSGWGRSDGYDGPCTDDEWEVAHLLDMIDPFFRQDEIARLRRLVVWLGGDDVLAAADTREGREALDKGQVPTDSDLGRAIEAWRIRQQAAT